MEEEIEFNFEFPQIELTPLNYVAVFDKETGAVVSVGPEDAFLGVDNKISVDRDFVDGVVDCSINIHNCFVDFYDFKLEIKETKTLNKIDDVVHRIPESKYVDYLDADIYASYNYCNKILSIELSERFGGTRPLVEKASKKQKMVWSGDTRMNFFITEYNDPHKLIHSISICLNDLIDKSFELELYLPQNFSIFTRRLFKKYIMELK